MDHTAKLQFYALAEALSLPAAARSCGATQKSILKSLGEVEREYGAKLCFLEEKRVSLTSAGRRLRDSLRSAGIDESGDETVSILEDPLSEHGIAEWIKTIALQQWPSMSIEISKGDYQEPLRDPNVPSFDLAFMFGWPRFEHPDLMYTRLYDQDICAFVARAALNLDRRVADLKTFQRWLHVIPSTFMFGLEDLLFWESRKAGCRPIVKTTDRKQDFLSLIRSGAVVGFAPGNFLDPVPLSIARLRYEPRMTIPMVVIHRKYESSRSVHRLLNLACRITDPNSPRETADSSASREVRRSLHRLPSRKQSSILAARTLPPTPTYLISFDDDVLRNAVESEKRHHALEPIICT